MPNQDEMLNTIENDRGSRLLDIARQEYPYLQDKQIDFLYSPNKREGYLEFYPPEETGSPDYPRPKELPMGRVGIEVFNPKTRPIDVLGDYVSHYGVNVDPQLKDYYSRFQQMVPVETMQKRYQEHQKLFGEQRPYQEWYEVAGFPEYFRGYVFDQFPREVSQRQYTPEQLRYLDEVRKYLGIK
jgi:hypothetical protein